MWRMSAQDHSAVSSLFQATSLLSRPGPGYKNVYLDMTRPPPTPSPPQRPESPFIPIFARRDLPGSGRVKDARPDALNLMSNLPAILPPVAQVPEDEDVNLYKEHMIVVDGWQTFSTSSPLRLPSPTSSQEDDEIDQLFEVSSPNTEPQLAELLEASKIDVIISRTKQWGRSSEAYTPAGAGKKLGAFLHPLLPALENDPQPQICPRTPEKSDSVVGQPPSAIGPQENTVQDAEVASFYKDTDLLDVKETIMNEKPDDNNVLLMDGAANSNILIPWGLCSRCLSPKMLPPNVHPPNELFLPKSLTDFLAPTKASTRDEGIHPTRIASLRIALSWVPFTVDSQLPNHAQISDVVDPPCAGPEENPKVQGLLQTAGVMSSEPDAEPKDHWADQDAKIQRQTRFHDDLLDFNIILTRRERHRLAGLRDVDVGAVEDTDFQIESGADTQASFSDRPVKRQRAGDDLLGLDFDQDKENVPPFQLLDDGFGQYLEYDNPYPVVENSQADAEYQLGYYESFTAPMDQALELEDIPEPVPFEHEQTSRPQNNPPFRNPVEVHPTHNAVTTTQGEMTMSREPELASHALGILTFAQLRGKQVQPTVEVQHALSHPCSAHWGCQGPHVTPESLFDCNTLRLPSRETFQTATSTHVYMASLETIQKQALVRALRSRECAIDLVERNSLDGMDLILDPQTGVLFMSLFLLPSQCAALTTRIGAQSWRFARILVVYEAYPAAHSYKERQRGGVTLNAYTPPIMKALSKVRRDLDITEACGDKRAGVVVQYAFANDVCEAAMFVRHYGELAESASPASVLWDAREWLDEEVGEDEEALAGVGAMNRFSAAVVLAQVGAEELLEMTPEARAAVFGPLIGYDVVDTFNSEMERRFQVLESSDNADMSVAEDA
ncbi:hypothetical protein BD779DRAFT_1518834 [Infundibulicybe gibba]|nr:hypothetical protein BD779DRAFT_1518834 [Infundibulicybe gibba]